MKTLPFAAFAVVCVLTMAAQLVFALREWRSLRRREPIFIDQLYVKVERYFGLAFRSKLESWLQLPAREVAGNVRVIDKEHEEIWVYEHLVLPPGAVFTGVIAADSLETGYGCQLVREVLTRGRCHIGARNVLQAVASDGELVLDRGTHVARWVDAAGDVVLEPGCHVGSRVTSARRVLLHDAVTVASVSAPLIETTDGTSQPAAPITPATGAPVVLGDDDEAWQGVGAPKKRRKLAEAIVYDGDLALPAVHLNSAIVVRGNLLVGDGSTFRGDVKAHGSIRIGAQSTCLGNLVAGGDIDIGADVTFHGVVFSETAVRIGARTTGTEPEAGVAIYGASTVTLGPGVRIRGKVAAGMRVEVRTELKP